jgi:hypothetical protein
MRSGKSLLRGLGPKRPEENLSLGARSPTKRGRPSDTIVLAHVYSEIELPIRETAPRHESPFGIDYVDRSSNWHAIAPITAARRHCKWRGSGRGVAIVACQKRPSMTGRGRLSRAMSFLRLSFDAKINSLIRALCLARLYRVLHLLRSTRSTIRRTVHCKDMSQETAKPAGHRGSSGTLGLGTS